MEILARRAVNFAALSLVLIFCLGLGAQPLADTASSSAMFDAITPVMNTAREISTATLLPNGKVLIAGGFGNAGALSSTELYDQVTNTFAAPASTPVMNTARGGATATLLDNGKVLIAGGSDSTTNLSSTELYDPATNTFAASASTPVMNSPRVNATATLLPNGKVLIAGTGDSSTELYDPATNTFAPPASTAVMNTARFAATATLLPNGKVLIAGGETNGSPLSLSSTELYDSATNTFAPSNSTAVMNSGREAATATLLTNGLVLIAGGQLAFEAVLNSTELYDPAGNTFAPSNSTVMGGARVGATATLLLDGKVLIAGGQNLVGPHLYNSVRSTDLYDPDTNTFAASTPMMNTARDRATATLLGNGKVLIAGGQSSVGAPPNTTVLSSTELYSPAQ